ncbi:MAG TPA: response regulator [Ohtaekwangia sp.]
MLILYAEDDVEDFEFFCYILNYLNLPAKCLHTKNGVETLDFLENASVYPDLILLDINMPYMDGRACLKAIKTDPRFKALPVVMYTTSTSSKDKDLCRQLGALEYLEKPHSIDGASKQLMDFFQRFNNAALRQTSC